MKHPFSVFIDFESTLQSTNKQSQEIDIIFDDEPLEDEIKTTKLQEHIPNSVGIKYNCIHPQYTKPIKIINNPDPEPLLKQTIQSIETYTFKSYKLLQQNKLPSDIKITNEQLQEHNKINICKYCILKLNC